MSLSDFGRKEAFKKVAQLCACRYEGNRSEDQIAKVLKFHSAEAMHIQLKNWELPEWLIQTKASKAEGKGQKAREGGEAVKLPPAGAARDLFRRALRRLSRYVDPPEPPTERPVSFMDVDFTEGAGLLGSLEEYLQERRFVSIGAYRPDPDEAAIVRRDALSKEEWERACEEHGEDPDRDHFLIGAEMGISSYGAAPYPWDGLVELIGAYVLVGEPLEPLLEKLHKEPEKVDREQLKRLIHGYKKGKGYVPGMLDKARQIARLVRGGSVSSGPSTKKLSELDLHVAWLITELKEQGLSYVQIHRELRKRRYYTYTRADVERLGDINPPRPE